MGVGLAARRDLLPAHHLYTSVLEPGLARGVLGRPDPIDRAPPPQRLADRVAPVDDHGRGTSAGRPGRRGPPSPRRRSRRAGGRPLGSRAVAGQLRAAARAPRAPAGAPSSGSSRLSRARTASISRNCSSPAPSGAARIQAEAAASARGVLKSSASASKKASRCSPSASGDSPGVRRRPASRNRARGPRRRPAHPRSTSTGCGSAPSRSRRSGCRGRPTRARPPGRRCCPRFRHLSPSSIIPLCIQTLASGSPRRRRSGPARSRGAGRAGPSHRRGCRVARRALPRPSRSTRCASRAGRAPGRVPARVLAGLVAFQSAKSSASSLRSAPSTPSPWSIWSTSRCESSP